MDIPLVFERLWQIVKHCGGGEQKQAAESSLSCSGFGCVFILAASAAIASDMAGTGRGGGTSFALQTLPGLPSPNAGRTRSWTPEAQLRRAGGKLDGILGRVESRGTVKPLNDCI